MSELHDAVLASWAAYTKDPLAPTPESLGFTNVKMLPDGRGFTGIKGKTFWVCVAGTYRPADFVTDARIAMVPVTLDGKPAFYMHAGFWANSQDLARQVDVDYQAALLLGCDKVKFTGHSLGAADAATLARRFDAPCTLITFGQPFTGDADWVAYNSSNIIESIRVRHDRDIIPTIPRLLFAIDKHFPYLHLPCLDKRYQYVHCGKLLHLSPDGGKLRWFDRLFRVLTLDIPLITDHPIARYEAAVKRHSP